MARKGKVVTFYSYKGGVGRSFALANIAALLGRWGAKVLCIDWDLEAPGLNYYFDKYVDGRHKAGLADLLTAYETSGQFNWKSVITPTKSGSKLHNVDFISSGSRSSGYYEKIRNIRISELYEERLGWDLQAAKEEWCAEYDFVFIDCRTGITEVGGMCVSHLADIVCPVFTANSQSIDGTIEVLSRAENLRKRLPFDLPTLLKLPILSRFDRREETDRAEEWHNRCLRKIARLYRPWANDKIDLQLLLSLTTIPYISRWTFGEDIATLEEREGDPEAISYSIASVSALLAQGLAGADRFVAARDVYVAKSRRTARTSGRYVNDVFISCPDNLIIDASAISASLKARGLSVLLSRRDDDVQYLRDMVRGISECRHMIMYVDDKPLTRSQLYEAETFIIQSMNDDDERQFFPILTARASISNLPSYMRRYQFMDSSKMGADDIASRIARQIARLSASID